MAQLVKNPPAMWETWVWYLSWEDPLEKGKATHSKILAWRIPLTVWSTASQRVGHDWATSLNSSKATVYHSWVLSECGGRGVNINFSKLRWSPSILVCDFVLIWKLFRNLLSLLRQSDYFTPFYVAKYIVIFYEIYSYIIKFTFKVYSWVIFSISIYLWRIPRL